MPVREPAMGASRIFWSCGCLRADPVAGKGERKAWMNWIKGASGRWADRLGHSALKPHRELPEAMVACIRNYEANMDRMRCDLLGPARLAGRIRHREKCLQAHRREKPQKVGVPLVEGGR